jgi:hypothetical protein
VTAVTQNRHSQEIARHNTANHPIIVVTHTEAISPSNMMRTRKPKVGLQRPPAKPLVKPKAKSIDQQELNKDRNADNPKNITAEDHKNINITHENSMDITQETSTKHKPPSTTNDKEEEWQRVSPKYLTRSDTQRKDIARIMPKIDAIIHKKIKSTTDKIPQWQITKFRTLKNHIETTNPSQLKVKDIYSQMRTIAKNIGQSALFDRKPIPRKTTKRTTHATQFTPESLNDEFDENRAKDDFDMDSLPTEQEPMPDLHYDTTEEDDLDKEYSENSSIDLLGSQNDFDDDATETNETRPLPQTKIGKIGNRDQTDFDDEAIKTNETRLPPQTKIGKIGDRKQTKISNRRQTYQDTIQNEAAKSDKITQRDDDILDETTKHIEDQLQTAQRLLDKEVQEIENMHLHTPKTHRTESYDKYDFEGLAAQAIHNQLAAKQEEMAATWQAQRDEMENTWIHNRADMERQYKNAFHVIEQDITNAKQTLEDIRSQNEALQQKVNAKTQQLGQL